MSEKEELLFSSAGDLQRDEGAGDVVEEEGLPSAESVAVARNNGAVQIKSTGSCTLVMLDGVPKH